MNPVVSSYVPGMTFLISNSTPARPIMMSACALIIEVRRVEDGALTNQKDEDVYVLSWMIITQYAPDDLPDLRIVSNCRAFGSTCIFKGPWERGN